MGRALEVISGRATNPGAAVTAVTVNTGDSLTVRSFPFESPASVIQVWFDGGTATGLVRLRSPRLHDNVDGFRAQVSARGLPLFPPGAEQRIFPQDTLSLALTGGAAETDVAALLLYYEDLPGTDARLATWDEIRPRIQHLIAVEQNVTAGATAGDYGGSQAINADFDQFKRNTDYALLGYTCDENIAVVGITGPETGNLRVGGPGPLRPDLTSQWFVWLSQTTGRATIPVINAANVGATQIDVVDTVASNASDISLILAQLGG